MKTAQRRYRVSRGWNAATPSSTCHITSTRSRRRGPKTPASTITTIWESTPSKNSVPLSFIQLISQFETNPQKSYGHEWLQIIIEWWIKYSSPDELLIETAATMTHIWLSPGDNDPSIFKSKTRMHKAMEKAEQKRRASISPSIPASLQEFND